MKILFKYLFIFALTFGIAGGSAYFGIRMFTQSAKEVVLPTLTGKNIIYVLETLTRMGLNVKLETTEYDDSVPRYAVISQSPKPGTTIKKGRNVTILLSKGPESILMPDLRLASLTQAELLLEKNDFIPGAMVYTHSRTTPKDRVIAQYPIPFSNTLKQTRCDLLISLGPRQPAMVMPNLTGLRLEAIPSLMDQHNLRISKITSIVDQTKNQGLVLSQTPKTGSHVTQTDDITLMVTANRENLSMPPENLDRLVLLVHQIKPGILNTRFTVKMNIEGIHLDLYNAEKKPGETVFVLIPSWNTSDIDILINDRRVRTFTIDPWNADQTLGELLPWELSPLPSYLPTLPNWEKS